MRKLIDDKRRAEIFGQYRRRLFGIAYRMLGTSADAEDIVQEAYLRWHKADAEEIESPEAWLVTVTTRLSIDRLRSAAKERETYIGPWLPEPLFAQKIRTPEEELEFADNISIAFLALLERLSPSERAAFLLHDIFDCSYQEIARIVGKNANVPSMGNLLAAHTKGKINAEEYDLELAEKVSQTLY